MAEVMADSEDRTTLNGLEKELFKLVSKGATKAQWAEWLRAPLEHALAQGDTSLALALLAAGADGRAGWGGCDGRTLLCAAAEGGRVEAVSAVLEAGGMDELDNVSGDQDMTALHHAIAGGHTDAAQVLVLAGADVELLDGRGRSALHYAVEGGHLKLAVNVILAGADVTAGDGDGDTALHLAAAHDDQAFVAALLRRGASVSAANKEGQQALHVAVKHDRVAVAEALLKGGADPNVLCETNISPLNLAHRNVAITRSLLKFGANADFADGATYSNSALFDCCAGQSGNTDVIETLIEAGASVDALSRVVIFLPTSRDWLMFGRPLHVATVYYNLGGMTTLLRHGAAVNAIDFFGQTPLHSLCKAARRANISHEMVIATAADLLLRWGADETLTDKKGLTPEQLLEGASVGMPLQEVLANAAADRAWRRRGMLVMCRAFPDKIPMRRGKPRAGEAKARRGRGGGSADGGQGRGNVLTRVVELEIDAIFRNVVEFL